MNRKDTARRLGPSPCRDDWMPATKETLMDRPEPTTQAMADAFARTTSPPVPAALASELVSLAAHLLHLRPDWEDPAADEELRRIAVRLGKLANGAAPRAPQAASEPHGTGDDAGAAHDPDGGSAGRTEPRMDPRDVPDALARAAVEGYYGHTIPDGGFAVLRGQWQRVLAAVIPAIRQQAIRDLEAGQIAAKELAAAGCEIRHIVDLRDDGWTIRHPLSCRPGLFDCPVNRAAERDLTEPPAARGAYACTIENGRFVVGEAA